MQRQDWIIDGNAFAYSQLLGAAAAQQLGVASVFSETADCRGGCDCPPDECGLM